MPEDDPFAVIEMALRDRAMTYPGATEEFPWDHRAIKVKGKIFLILDLTDGVLSATVKLPDSNAYALMQRYVERTGYGLGKSGWVTCRFRPGEEPPMDLLEEWIEESYRAVAPRKLVLALNVQLTGAEPPPVTVVKKPAANKSAPAKKGSKKTKGKGK